MKPWSSIVLGLFLSSAILVPAKAQISIDGTTNTTINSTDNGIRIDAGNRAGDNLFHSFEQFSIPNGSEAFFNNANDIVNIFSRVTGGDISNIDGLIRANGSASLFLINPAGIIFGEDAALNIGGSFLGSTASSILFPDGVEFSATDSENPPLLTINAPLGLGLQDNPGEIVNRSLVQNSAEEPVGLEVAPGNNLALIGGQINFERGQATARGGNIELGGLSEAGTVGINDNGSFSFPDGVTKADINLSNGADVDATGTGGGSVSVNAGNLNLSAGEFGSSFISAGIRPESTSAEAQAGDVTIDVAENITLNDSRISNQVDTGGVGNSGNITINTGSIEAINGGDVDASTSGLGDAGAISITAKDTVSFHNDSFVFSRVNGGAQGNSGGVVVNTGTLNLTKGGQINADTFGQGDGADILVNARDSVNISGSGRFASGLYSNNNNDLGSADGDAGNININTGSIEVIDGAVIDAGTEYLGNAGAVNITAKDTVSFHNDSFVFSRVNGGAEGNSGGVVVTTGTLNLTKGGQINADTFGQGDGADILVNARDSVNISGSGRFASGLYSNNNNDLGSADGDAGNININTGSLEVIDGAVIDAGTEYLGNAGAVNITAKDTVSFHNDSFVFSRVNGGAEGNSGGVVVTTGTLNLTKGGQINADTFGQGDGADILVNARDSVNISGSGRFASGLYANALQGNAGNININTDSLEVIDGAVIDSRTEGRGKAGAVNITAKDTVSFHNDSYVFSRVNGGAEGNSGGVVIKTGTLNLTKGGQINADTFGQGDGGNIVVKARDSVNISGFGSYASGLYANALQGNGNGGNLRIATDKLIVRDQAVITVGNFFDQGIAGTSEEFLPGKGAAGNLEINAGSVEVSNQGTITADNANGVGGQLMLDADSLTLENEASISASTTAEQGQGGILTLDIDDILFISDRSLISARADSGANGGNIDIDAGFVITAPNLNNDIIASAAQGDGGNIDITTNSIFGIEERSATPINNTNDIDASSEFGLDGTIAINELEVNPAEALEELPTEIIDVAGLVEQNLCQQTKDSEFIVTGKGGIAPNPTQARDGEISAVDLVEPATFEEDGEAEGRGGSRTAARTKEEIVEAQGWMINDRGKVELVAQKTDVNGSPPQPKDAKICSK